MKITKLDPMLGKKVTLDVPITYEEYLAINKRVLPIQDIVPNLSEDYREFLISGISPEGWKLYEVYNFEQEVAKP